MAIKNRKKDVTDQFYPAHQFNIKDFKFTPKQRELVQIIRNSSAKVVFIEGPAGSAKSFLAVFCGLMALREGSKSKFKYIRALVESSQNKMGYLPGDFEQKTNPYCQALDDKLEELLDLSDIQQLKQNESIQLLPPNFLRGVTFTNQYILIDEAQELPAKDLITILTRIGENTTLVFAGDTMQSDIRNSGFADLIKIFDDGESKEKGIHSFRFGIEDVLRSDILRFILDKINTSKQV